MSSPGELPFEFEPLLEHWAATGGITPALGAIREFLNARARTILDYLPDDQLHWALAAWQREGELLFAQRQWAAAQSQYRELAELLAPHHAALAAWCRGAMAECRIQMGEVADGLADLADLLEELEDQGYAAGITAVEQAIVEAAEGLGDAG